MPSTRLDEELDVLLADIRRDADHGAILDGLVLGRDMLDLPGRDVLAPAAHAVGHPAVEIEIAVGSKEPRSPVCKRVLAQGLRRRLGIVEIAGEDRAGRCWSRPRSRRARPCGTGWPSPSSSFTVNQGIGRPTEPTTPVSLQVVMLEASVMP